LGNRCCGLIWHLLEGLSADVWRSNFFKSAAFLLDRRLFLIGRYVQ
jgi:hypothetical protein